VGLYSGTAADLLATEPGSSFPPAGFKRVHSAPVSCITWTVSGIYVCTSQSQKGFALGFAPDLASLENDELAPLLDVTQIVGPLGCPAQTTTSLCGPEWEATCEDLGACGNEPGAGGAAGAANEGPSSGASGGSSGNGNPGPSGGEPSGAGATASAGATAEPTERDSESDDSGCAVHAPPQSGRSSFALLAAALLFVLGRRARNSA
jgi:hypothetical protein